MDYHQHDSQLKAQLRKLNQQTVRDLAWCCLSPPLLALLPDIQTMPQLDHHHDSDLLDSDLLDSHHVDSHLWPWLYQLDKEPAALIDLIQQRKSTRLGLYYETLWQFYFMEHPEWELLAYNQQIHHHNATLGAFDFLCRKGDEYWHMETAVKFYLCAATATEPVTDWHQWIGPDKSDRLDLKLNHLRKHQLQLSQHPVAQHWLREHFPHAENWKNALCLQGYFFQHNKNQQPDHAHPWYCRGKWLTLDSFLQAENNFTDSHWLLLKRHLWLSPAQTTLQEKLLDTAQLKAMAFAHLEGENRPLLVAVMREWENVWQEETRYFLVPNHWPQIAAR